MARIDAAAIRVDRQWVTAADVVDAASAHVRHTLEGRALRIDADADTEVDIDPRLASVALSHVLENAAQYSPADGEILVQARIERDGLHVSVTDRGPGLDPGELEHLFERFYRGHTARKTTFGVRDGSLDHARTAGGGRWTDLGGERARRREVLHRRSRRCPLDRRHTVTSYGNNVSAHPHRRRRTQHRRHRVACCGHEGMTFFLQ